MDSIENAIYRGDLDELKRIRQQGADMRRADALAIACSEGQMAIVEWLIGECGFRPDEEVCHGFSTPLIIASRGGHLETVDLLIDRGAQIDQRAGAGDTALAAAVREC